MTGKLKTDTWTPPFFLSFDCSICGCLSSSVQENGAPAGTVSSSSSSVAPPAEAFFVFEEIFCLTFELLDRIWLEEKADYMQFPNVLKKVEDVLTKAMAKAPKTTAELSELLQN